MAAGKQIRDAATERAPVKTKRGGSKKRAASKSLRGRAPKEGVKKRPRKKDGREQMKRNMLRGQVVLALDLGTSLGWALATADRSAILSGVVALHPGRFEGGGVRYLRFRNWLETMRDKHQFDVIVFEEVRGHVAVDAAHIYGGLLGTLSAWCEHAVVPYIGVHTGEWKKGVLGNGAAKKEEIQAYVARELGLPEEEPADPVLSSDEADAVGVLLYATGRRYDVKREVHAPSSLELAAQMLKSEVDTLATKDRSVRMRCRKVEPARAVLLLLTALETALAANRVDHGAELAVTLKANTKKLEKVIADNTPQLARRQAKRRKKVR